MFSYLLDTNILLRIVQNGVTHHVIVRDAVTRLIADGHTLCLTSQVLMEFWVVATRPEEVNGFGWSPSFVKDELSRLQDQFRLLPERADTFEYWQQLVSKHEIKGKKAHDVRLVAAMQAHKIGHILTFNVKDFAVFTQINAVHPRYVLSEET